MELDSVNVLKCCLCYTLPLVVYVLSLYGSMLYGLSVVAVSLCVPSVVSCRIVYVDKRI